MAKSLLSVRSKKTVRKTKSETYLVNLKYMGSEPEYNGALEKIDYIKAFNWYNVMIEEDEAREYVYDFFKKSDRASLISKLKRVPFSKFRNSSMWLLRIATRGGKVDPELLNKAIQDIVNTSQYATEPTSEIPIVNKTSIQDRIKDKISEVIGDIEGIIDDGDFDINFYDWLKARQIPAMYVSKIISFYAPVLEELVLAYKGKDEQLVEAYKHLKKKELEKRIKFFHALISDAEKYGDSTKKLRAPRKKKTVSAEKKLKHMKIQAESKEYKVASVNPERIIGAQEVWTFNTKYKTLTVFRAQSHSGLDVNRSSIINYDEKTSITKRIGRKTEYYVDRVLNGGKVVLKKLMDEIKTESPLQMRMNENTILLKVT